MKLTVYVEKVGYAEDVEDVKFRVVRVRNGTEPGVGDILGKPEIDHLVASGIEVIIDLPRRRE